jgi:serine/threonine protein kinase
LSNRPSFRTVNNESINQLQFHIFRLSVQALERINVRNGITVIISADEGASRFDRHRLQSEDTIKTGETRSYSLSTTVTSDVSLIDTSSTSIVIHPAPSEANTQQYDLATFLRFAINCTDCLEFIHRNNTIHGELRLSSFFWSEEDEGKVKIASFGQGARSFESYLTSEGWRKNFSSKDGLAKLRNTLTYLSPEQTGRTNYIPDHRADIYSLGVIFFVILACKEPFEGGPLDILNGILSRNLTPIHELRPDVPAIITEIFEKMTAKVHLYSFSPMLSLFVKSNSLCISVTRFPLQQCYWHSRRPQGVSKTIICWYRFI